MYDARVDNLKRHKHSQHEDDKLVNTSNKAVDDNINVDINNKTEDVDKAFRSENVEQKLEDESNENVNEKSSEPIKVKKVILVGWLEICVDMKEEDEETVQCEEASQEKG